MASKLNKLKLQKELQNFVTKGMFRQKVQTTLAGTGNWTRELLHPKRMLYHCTTMSTESIGYSQTI